MKPQMQPSQLPVPQGNGEKAMEMTVDQLGNRRNKILAVMKSVMREGVDYGIIPGVNRPSLLKPGAEKLCATFMLVPTITVEDLSVGDERRYRVKVSLNHAPTGICAGEGIGEASSSEDKYKWRKTICRAEFEATDPERKREAWKKEKGTPVLIQQVRTNPEDIANTILKMSKKRGLVDATLTATAASDIFTQDVEDIPKEYIEGQDQASSARPPTPTEKPPTPQKKTEPEQPERETENESFLVEGIVSKYYPPTGKGPGALKLVDGDTFYKSFNTEILRVLNQTEGKKVALYYTIEKQGKYTNSMINQVKVLGK